MKFSVVIVNYNVKYYLEQCLCSLYRAIDNISAEIFVVDNASVDDSEKPLCLKMSWRSVNVSSVPKESLP